MRRWHFTIVPSILSLSVIATFQKSSILMSYATHALISSLPLGPTEEIAGSSLENSGSSLNKMNRAGDE